jgi:hypothetical protein
MDGIDTNDPRYRRLLSLSELMIKAREQTTKRLYKDIINKIKWHIWEKNARDLGKPCEGWEDK